MLSINYDCDCRGVMRREVETAANYIRRTSAFSLDAGVILSNGVRADSSPCKICTRWAKDRRGLESFRGDNPGESNRIAYYVASIEARDDTRRERV